MDVREIEAHFEFVAPDQPDGFFLGYSVVGDLDFVVVPSFADFELFGSIDSQGSVALGGVVCEDDRGAFWNVEGQGGFDRIVAFRWIEYYRFGAPGLCDHGFGLVDFLAIDLIDGLDFEPIRFAWAEVFADEMAGGSGRLGWVSVDEDFCVHGDIDGQLDFGGRYSGFGGPSSAC